MSEQGPQALQGWGALAVGLSIGVVAGAVGMHALDSRRDSPWIDAGAQWELLPSHLAAGPLPRTFATPARAYDYGATTKLLPPTIDAAAPALLRVELGKVTGKVGLALAKPDGSALLTREHPLSAADSGKPAYIRITGAEGPAAILVRNYGDEGRPGSVEIRSAAYASEVNLDAKAEGEINRAGVY